MQVDHLMDDGIENICSKMDSIEGSAILRKLCEVVCLDIPEPKENSRGNFKIDERNGMCYFLFIVMPKH